MTLSAATITARIVALTMLAAGIAVVLWSAFIRPGQLKSQPAISKAESTVATGREAAAQDATHIVERYHDRTTEIRTIQSAGVAAVLAAPDAVAGGVAARRAICLLDNERQLSDPACELLKARPGIDQAPGAGLAIPGG